MQKHSLVSSGHVSAYFVLSDVGFYYCCPINILKCKVLHVFMSDKHPFSKKGYCSSIKNNIKTVFQRKRQQIIPTQTFGN